MLQCVPPFRCLAAQRVLKPGSENAECAKRKSDHCHCQNPDKQEWKHRMAVIVFIDGPEWFLLDFHLF
jgi:hypothetical protein